METAEIMRGSRRYLPGMLAALAGLVTGWLLARGEPPPAATDNSPASERSRQSARAPRTPSVKPDRDHASYLQRFLASSPEADAAASVKRMDTGDLRRILLDSPASAVASHRDARNELHLRIMIATAAELFRREGPAALEWADASGSVPARLAIFAALCATNPESGRAGLQAFEDDCGSKDHYRAIFANASIDAAATRGPADLILAEKTWSKFADLGEIDFPENFDFAAYLKLKGVGAGADRTLHKATRAWAASDPEQVLKQLPYLIGPSNGGGQLVGMAIAGRAAMVGDEEAVRWGLSLLPHLSGAQRSSAFHSIASNFDLSSQSAAEIVTGLPEDEDRIVFAMTMLSHHSLENETFRATLKAFPSESLQVQFFIQMLESDGNTETGMPAKKLERFQNSLEKIGLSAESLTTILSTIPPWKPTGE